MDTTVLLHQTLAPPTHPQPASIDSSAADSSASALSASFQAADEASSNAALHDDLSSPPQHPQPVAFDEPGPQPLNPILGGSHARNAVSSLVLRRLDRHGRSHGGSRGHRNDGWASAEENAAAGGSWRRRLHQFAPRVGIVRKGTATGAEVLNILYAAVRGLLKRACSAAYLLVACLCFMLARPIHGMFYTLISVVLTWRRLI